MTRSIMRLILCSGLCLAFVPGSGFGQGKGKNKHQDKDDASVNLQLIFSSHDRDVIREYYSGGSSGLPPGLAKRNGKLPPGLQKHLEKNGTLPPGLQKKIEPFPVELERRLPRLPSGYSRVSIGVDVLILDRRTQRIMDIIYDVLRP
jgi:hypothetical protein